MGRTDASERSSIGKIKFFRENRLKARQIKVFLMLAVMCRYPELARLLYTLLTFHR
jgi:hypothetical protein